MPRIERFFANQKVPDWTSGSFGGGGDTSVALGGNTVATPGNGYTYHAFTSSGGFTVPATSPLDGTNVEVLVVAGGGAGGTSYNANAGGGGGGGVRLFPAVPITAGNTYGVKVGLGGTARTLLNDPAWGFKAWNEGGGTTWYPTSTGSTLAFPRQGEPSYFDAPYYNPGGGVIPGSSYESTGGGRGGGDVYPPAGSKPPEYFSTTSGGSGGGQSSPPSVGGTSIYARGNIYAYTPVEGYPANTTNTPYQGGGGGAAEAGWRGGYGGWAQTSPRTPSTDWMPAGYGGNGIYMPGWYPIGNGSSSYYGGGGGAGRGPSTFPGLGGYGGGGSGGTTNLPLPSKHGEDGLGGGGGGSGSGPGGPSPYFMAGDGGSGVVIVRYPA